MYVNIKATADASDVTPLLNAVNNSRRMLLFDDESGEGIPVFITEFDIDIRRY